MTLISELDLRAPLTRASEVGATFILQALTEPARAAINAEIAASSFEPLAEQVGPYGVREEAELLHVPPDDHVRYPRVAELCADLTELVHQHGRHIEGLSEWEPNDIAAMRYSPGSLGITPHRDGKRYRLLIAIFTIEGSAPFTLCADRDGDTIEQCKTTPGSLILMRGPGFNGAEDGRAFHTVAGPAAGTRMSLTFRS